MKKKMKRNRGITLIALVVTIVVLLILAGITIATLFGENGIITAAQRAANDTKQDEVNTQKGLDDLSSAISEQLGEYAWKLSKDGTKVINKNNPEGIELGSYVNYDCTPVAGAKTNYVSTADKNGYAEQTFTVSDYKYGWRVIGVDNRGQLLLLAEEVVPSTIEEGEDNTWGNNIGYTALDRTSYFIQGKIGFENGINEINAISDIYGHGKYATGGRSLTIEEINRMTGLNGNNIDEKETKYGKDQLDEYGNKVTFYWDGTDKPYYEATNGLKGNLIFSHERGFTYYDESAKKFITIPKPTSTTKELIITINCTDYYYSVQGTDMETNKSALYKTLFTNSGTGAYKDQKTTVSGVYYYLDSLSTACGSGCVAWGISSIREGEVYGGGSDGQVGADGREYYDCVGVRPAVSLKSNIKLSNKTQRPDGFYSYELGE